MAGRRRRGRKADRRYMGKGDCVLHMTGTEATLARMPYVNGFICRGGVHGDTSYNRRRAKEELRRRIEED